MNALIRKTNIFVVGYLLLLTPTYLLPLLGSNSSVLNALSIGTGHGLLPQWWAHAWCMVMLVLLVWLRGDFIGKKYLPILPFLAAVFDLTPGLNIVPFIPTVFHVATLILAVRVSLDTSAQDVMQVNLPIRKASALAGLMTLATLGGCAFFIIASKAGVLDANAKKESVVAKQSLSISQPVIAKSAIADAVSVLPQPSPSTDKPVLHTAHASHVAGHHVATMHPSVNQGAASGGQGGAQGGNTVKYINLND